MELLLAKGAAPALLGVFVMSRVVASCERETRALRLARLLALEILLPSTSRQFIR